jgi:15-cis-phytoene desaturase
MRQVAIVGAGLAGLSCGWELTKLGYKVALLESRDVLGGRTSSWGEDGMPVESGLHKYLGIYRALPRLLKEVGVDLDQMLSWVDELAFLTPDGRDGDFTVAPYRRPLGTAFSLLANNQFVSPIEKLKLTAFGIAGVTSCIRDPESLDRISIADYAARFGLSDALIQRVISTATQAILFVPAKSFSAYAVFAPIVEGFKHLMTFRLGAFRGGMSDVMIQPIAEAIERRGGEVRTGAAVQDLIFEENRVLGVRLDRETLLADHVVLAMPIGPAQALLRRHFAGHPWFESMLRLPTLSCVTLQAELTQPALGGDWTNFSPTTLACFAEQSHTTFPQAPGRLSAILYPPERFVEASPEEIFEQSSAAADELQIPLRATTGRYRVVTHKDAFYRMEPGTEPLRPTQETPIRGLSLAGDYTRQPFSASMEGAVLSGQSAAAAVVLANQ